MNQKKYSDEFKLQVIKDYLNSSLGCRAIAKKYNLPSKNYIDKWKKQLIKKGLLSENIENKPKVKKHTQKIIDTKTPYEKQLEKENYRLKAELAFYKEYRRLLDEDSKKKS